MQEIIASEFVQGPLQAAGSIPGVDVWHFPHWDAPRQAAESAPLRQLLSRYLDKPAERIRIVRDAYGKPHLADSDLEFNLSHCEASALVAVSAGVPLGIDLEQQRRDRPVLALAQRFFAGAEAAALEALPERLRQRAFLALWSCKEAVLKALGRGLGFGLERIVFELDERGEVDRLVCVEGDASDAWQVIKLTPAANCCGAVSWRGNPVAMRTFRIAPEHR
jgi:4'-phosphopantetheinyl transferase